MEKRRLPKRDAWIIVVLFHVGIVLLWVSMGGCGRSGTREVPDTATPGATEQLDSAYDTVEPDISIEEDTPAIFTATREVTEPANEIHYVVQPGDSLWKISRMFGVSMDSIADRNDIQDPALIRAGRELWIPNPTKGLDKTTSTEPTTTPIVEPTVTEPTTGEITTPTGEITTPTEEITTPTEPVDIGTIETFAYEVQPGDTIWKLARTYHTTTKIIMELNGITDAKTLRAGTTILIPKQTAE